MGKYLKTSPEGRKCQFPQCSQTLSIYNHEVYCNLHLDKMPQKLKHPIVEVAAPAVKDFTAAIEDNHGTPPPVEGAVIC